MVEKILEEYPVAVHDVDENQKNVVLLAVESRQPKIYEFLLKQTKTTTIPREVIFGHLDSQGNSALHIAATQCKDQRPWLSPGSTIQMQRESKWYKLVENSMPPNFFRNYNNDNETATDIFAKQHEDLAKKASETLSQTSQNCSVVAVLVASVAFATSSTVPGGLTQDKGLPVLQHKPLFIMFSMSSFIALCSSVMSLIFFLGIITTHHKYDDYAVRLPRKLLLGLSSLSISIVAMLVSFFGGHSLVLQNSLRDLTYPFYMLVSIPLAFFTFSQISIYVDVLFS